jgi:hypothetical protein
MKKLMGNRQRDQAVLLLGQFLNHSPIVFKGFFHAS